MPLLNLPQRTVKKSITIKIQQNVVEDLRAYAQFANASLNDVVQEAMLHVFQHDEEFQKWKDSSAFKKWKNASRTPSSAPAETVSLSSPVS